MLSFFIAWNIFYCNFVCLSEVRILGSQNWQHNNPVQQRIIRWFKLLDKEDFTRILSTCSGTSLYVIFSCLFFVVVVVYILHLVFLEQYWSKSWHEYERVKENASSMYYFEGLLSLIVSSVEDATCLELTSNIWSTEFCKVIYSENVGMVFLTNLHCWIPVKLLTLNHRGCWHGSSWTCPDSTHQFVWSQHLVRCIQMFQNPESLPWNSKVLHCIKGNTCTGYEFFKVASLHDVNHHNFYGCLQSTLDMVRRPCGSQWALFF